MDEQMRHRLKTDLRVAPFAESNDDRCSEFAEGDMGRTRCTRKPKHDPYPHAAGYIPTEQRPEKQPVLVCAKEGEPRRHAHEVDEIVQPLDKAPSYVREMFRCLTCGSVRQWGRVDG